SSFCEYRPLEDPRRRARGVAVRCPWTFAGPSRAQAAPRFSPQPPGPSTLDIPPRLRRWPRLTAAFVAADTPVSAAPPPYETSTWIPRSSRQRPRTPHNRRLVPDAHFSDRP